MTLPKGYNPQDLPGQIVDEGWSGRIVDAGTGAGLFTSNTDYNVVGVDPLTGTTSPIGTDMGFGAAVRRWIQAGVYNGDFAVSPNAPGTPIEDAYNMLPYWSFQPTQSGQIIAYVESQDFQAFQTDAFEVTAFAAATDTSAGRTQLRFQMIPGGYAADDAYLTQLVPVTTTADEVFELEAGFTILEVSDTDANAKAYIAVEFLQANLLASTASPSSTTVEASLAADATFTIRAPVIAIPDDAAYARLRLGMRRGSAAVTDAAEFAISEVFIHQRERRQGTLTPGVSFGGASVGVTYATQSGEYVRNGRLVTVFGRIDIISNGSSSGTPRITGLPFTTANVAYAGVVSVGYYDTFTSATIITGIVDGNATTISLFGGGTTSSQGLTEANVSDGASIVFSCTYLAAT